MGCRLGNPFGYTRWKFLLGVEGQWYDKSRGWVREEIMGPSDD